jgi:DNA-binding ferritin-like protein
MILKKENFIAYIRQTISQQLKETHAEIKELREEIANETKSSAGDKFETSREMMQQMLDQLEHQAWKRDLQLKSLDQLSLSHKTR